MKKKTSFEIELEKLFLSFRKKPEHSDKLIQQISRLHEERSWHKNKHTPLQKKVIEKKIDLLLQKLTDAKNLLAEVQSHNTALRKSSPMEFRKITLSELSFTRTPRSEWEALHPDSPDMDSLWMVDMIETLTSEIRNRTDRFKDHQMTPANLDHSYLLMVAMFCRAAGMSISESKGSQFYKIAAVFLKKSQPVEQIKRARAELP